MDSKGSIEEYIQSLLKSKRMEHQVAFHTTLPEKKPAYKDPKGLVSDKIQIPHFLPTRPNGFNIDYHCIENEGAI